MILPIIFYVSGACIALLLFVKLREMQMRRQPMLLRLISRGDERMKVFSQKSAHWYADRKEDVIYFFEKQLPVHSRRLWAKAETLAAEKWNLLAEDLRKMQILKRREGLTEYFQTREEEIHMNEELMEAMSESEASDIEENRVE